MQKERDVAVFTNGTIKVQDLDSGEEVELGTDFVGRDKNLWVGPASESLDDDGAVVVHRNGIVERYKPYRRATQQSWSFPTVPAGKGDLVIRVRLPNVTQVDAVGDNLKIQTATATFLYEAATWIDASGTRTNLVPKWNGTSIEITIPSSVLDTSSYPALLDPLMGPWPASTPPTPAYAPSVASSGTQYLVAWEDYSSLSNAARILARRYDTNGGVLDATPITIDSVSGSIIQGEPTVGFNGTDYVVAWWDNNNNQGRNRVKARRVNTSGTVLGTAVQFENNSSKPSQYAPNIACKNNGDCGIAYHVIQNAKGNVEFAGYYTNYAAVTPTPVARGPISITTGSVNSVAPAVATNNSQYFVVWESGNYGSASIRGRRVTTNGTFTTDTAGTDGPVATGTTDNEAFAPSVAWSGTGTQQRYIVGFARYTPATLNDAKSIPVTTGNVAPTAGTEQSLRSGAGDQDNVAITCSGGNCTAAVWDNSNIYQVNVNAVTGAGLSGAAFNTTSTGYRENPRIAASSSNYFAVWSDRRITSPTGVYQVWGNLGGERLVSIP